MELVYFPRRLSRIVATLLVGVATVYFIMHTRGRMSITAQYEVEEATRPIAIEDNTKHTLTEQQASPQHVDENLPHPVSASPFQLLPEETRPIAGEDNEQTKRASIERLALLPANEGLPLPVLSTFQLPIPKATHSIDSLLVQPWMKELQEILSHINPHAGPITITTSDYNFRDILLNWLAASTAHVTPGLSNVLVLCMDKSLYDLLKSRDILCIYAPLDSFIKKSITVTFKNHTGFSATMILRLIVMRFLNHWGYDVANYDVDALVAKNPKLLYYETFKESKVIGSHGYFPSKVKDVWGGSTMCAGAFMVKSGPETEIFWQMMSNVSVLLNSVNDQEILNTALLKLNVHWDASNHGDITVNDWQGATDGGLRVAILSILKICRQSCHKAHRKDYYVWHKGGSGREGKMKYAQQGRLWFLRSDWEELNIPSALKGVNWLKAISITSDHL